MSEGSFDVLIAGGGVVGSAVAHFLTESSEGRGLRVGILEPDPTYARSSTALSVGGIRQQFSTPENILLSRFTVEFIRSAGERLRVGDLTPEMGFVEAGYLFLATEAGREVLWGNHRIQERLGADVALLTPPELRERFPWLQVDDLAAGSLGLRGEGWLDPHSLLQALRRKAISRGAEYITDRVVAVEQARGRVRAIRTESGERLPTGWLVNAAGPRAREVAAMAGIPDLPVRPRKRIVYRFHCPEPIPGAPLTIDPSGVYFRPEGPDFLCGVSPVPEEDPDTLDLETAWAPFYEAIWPTLAMRVPAFETLKLGSSWAGLYAVNTWDQNAVLGPHPEIHNLIFANGFSGHGLQHAPGIGRAVSELILEGAYRTLDLGRFGFHRFASGDLLLERNVV